MFKQKDGTWFALMPIAEADIPGAYSVEFLAASGERIDSARLTIRPTVFPTQNVNLAPQIEELKSSPEEIQTLTTFRNSVSDERFWDDPLVAPVTVHVSPSMRSVFTMENRPVEFHGGVDQRRGGG